jgi:Bacterial Ig domain
VPLRTRRGDVRLATVVVCLAVSDLVVNPASAQTRTNKAPTVSLTSPANGASFAAGTKITVSASAADSDGTVSRVQFYAGSTLIGTDTSSPYSVSWSPVIAGSYTLKAVATDNAGATAASATRTVTVKTSSSSSNQWPWVSFTSPTSGAIFTAPATIWLSASAGDTGGYITRVDFYRGSTLIASDTTSPYGVSWGSVPAGSYSLTAVARDNAGAYTVSPVHTVTVTTSTTSSSSNPAPWVTFSSPSSGAIFTAPATIALSATAGDTGGYITRVDFYRGSTLIASDTSSPYSFSWTNVPAGSYSLTAVARDNGGATTVSSTRDITVKSATMPTTAAFTPSSNHATSVDRYLLEIFPAGADTRIANPVATRDLGKPSIYNGEIRVDVASTILGLSPGNYVATVTAFGSSGSTQSAASPQFTR